MRSYFWGYRTMRGGYVIDAFDGGDRSMIEAAYEDEHVDEVCEPFMAEDMKSAMLFVIDEILRTTGANVSDMTHSEIGSAHWFNTHLAFIKHCGEYLVENRPPDEATLQEWGKRFVASSVELIDWFKNKD